MAISACSFAASSGRFPARYCAAESLRCLIIDPITPTTSASSSGFAFSISRYFIWLLSRRSVPSRRASLARAASFMSASIRSASIASRSKAPREIVAQGPLGTGVDSERKELHHSLPRLLQGALLRRQRLLLALDRRLFVVLALPDLAQDASFFALLLEALHGVLERLAFLDAHARHSPNHHFPAREGASGRNSASRKRGSISADSGVSNLPTQAAPDIYSQIVPVAGAHLQDTLRRREHRARNEVARQIGLINLGTLAGGLAHELSTPLTWRSEEHTSELQSPCNLVCRLLLEKKKKKKH